MSCDLKIRYQAVAKHPGSKEQSVADIIKPDRQQVSMIYLGPFIINRKDDQ